MRERTANHPLPLRLLALCTVAALSTSACRDSTDQSAEPVPDPASVARTPADGTADETADSPGRGHPWLLEGQEWAEIDLDEMERLCDSVGEDIDDVETAAESIEQDILVDDIPYLEQDREVLEDHMVLVEELEALFSDTELGNEVTERAEAVDTVLFELDHGYVDTLEDALDRVADTHDPLLEFCEL